MVWSLATFLVVVAIILGALAIFFVSGTSPAAAISVVVLLVLVFLVLGLISSTSGGIYSAAVYDYAVGGSPGEFFREDPIKTPSGRRVRSEGFSLRSSSGASPPP